MSGAGESVRERANALKSWIIDECPDTSDVELAVPFVHIDALAGRVAEAESERDDYRFWNERVRTCAAHTQDVAAPVGDCLVCNAEELRARVAEAEKALAEARGLLRATLAHMEHAHYGGDEELSDPFVVMDEARAVLAAAGGGAVQTGEVEA